MTTLFKEERPNWGW